MTILKVVSPIGKSTFFDELPDSYLKIVYGTEKQLRGLYQLRGVYLVDSEHSVEKLIEAIPIWLKNQDQSQSQTRIAVYTLRTVSENEELINKLSELQDCNTWFSRGLVFCNE